MRNAELWNLYILKPIMEPTMWRETSINVLEGEANESPEHFFAHIQHLGIDTEMKSSSKSCWRSHYNQLFIWWCIHRHIHIYIIINKYIYIYIQLIWSISHTLQCLSESQFLVIILSINSMFRWLGWHLNWALGQGWAFFIFPQLFLKQSRRCLVSWPWKSLTPRFTFLGMLWDNEPTNFLKNSCGKMSSFEEIADKLLGFPCWDLDVLSIYAVYVHILYIYSIYICLFIVKIQSGFRGLLIEKPMAILPY